MKLTVELDSIQQRKLQEYLHKHRQVLATAQALKYRGNPTKCPVLESVALLYDQGVYAPFVGTHGSDVEYTLIPCALGTRILASYFNNDPIDLTDYTNW